MRKYLLIGLVVIVAACQKNSSLSPSATSVNKLQTKQVNIDTLRSYLARLTSLKVSDVSYNSGSKQFEVFGKSQISLQELTTTYNTLPIKRLKKRLGVVNFTHTDPIGGDPGPGGGGDPGNGDGGGGGGGGTPPSLPPYADIADTLNSYDNNLINYETTSTTFAYTGGNYTDITKGVVTSYSIAITGSGGGSLSGNDLYIKYNQSQMVKVTVNISVPHDNLGKVVPFKVNATLLQWFDQLNPKPLTGYGISIDQTMVKQTDVIVTKTFNISLPVAAADIDGEHLSLYWNNATSAADEKFTLDPIYTMHVLGLPTGEGTEQTGSLIYLYRLFYAPGGEHFYTSSGSEKSYLMKEYPNGIFPSATGDLLNNPNHYWLPEGNIGEVYRVKAQNTVPLFRLFNGSVHMYTIDPSERDNLIANLGYWTEGISGYVYSTQVPGSQPIHRYAGTSSAGHFFTIDHNEIGDGSGYGFTYEGVSWYDIP